MGFRTVVMLCNDQAHEWSNDPGLGKRISLGMNYANGGECSKLADLGYGRVVECVHADCQTLAVLDGYSTFEMAAIGSWTRGESGEDRALKLLKEAAKSLGYRLVKRSK